jgi:hypothetical protein
MRNAYNNYIARKSERKTLIRPRHRWEDNIETSFIVVVSMWNSFIWIRIWISGGPS